MPTLVARSFQSAYFVIKINIPIIYKLQICMYCILWEKKRYFYLGKHLVHFLLNLLIFLVMCLRLTTSNHDYNSCWLHFSKWSRSIESRNSSLCFNCNILVVPSLHHFLTAILLKFKTFIDIYFLSFFSFKCVWKFFWKFSLTGIGTLSKIISMLWNIFQEYFYVSIFLE